MSIGFPKFFKKYTNIEKYSFISCNLHKYNKKKRVLGEIIKKFQKMLDKKNLMWYNDLVTKWRYMAA